MIEGNFFQYTQPWFFFVVVCLFACFFFEKNISHKAKTGLDLTPELKLTVQVHFHPQPHHTTAPSPDAELSLSVNTI